MRDYKVVEITYKPFKRNQENRFTIEPFCLKLHENRWYVLGRNNRKEVKLYGLDRIGEARILDTRYTVPKDFVASEFFAPFYGVEVGYNIKPEKIVLRANKIHKFYLKSLPLHETQKVIEDYGDFADFELYVAPTNDFIMKLLQYGAMIEVISPQSLRRSMKGWISDMYELYKNDQ